MKKEIKIKEAQSPDTLPGRLAELAENKDKDVRRAVAGNRYAPTDTLARLTGDKDKSVRQAAAYNPHTPDIECKAIKASWRESQWDCDRLYGFNAVGAAKELERRMNERFPLYWWRAYYDHNDLHMAQTVYGFAGPTDEEWEYAEEQRTLLEDDWDYWVLEDDPDTLAEESAETLVELATDEDWYIRRAVALNPHTPPDILVRLAGDEDADVRRGAAENPHTPLDTLAVLVSDNDHSVRKAVAHNERISREMLDGLANDKSAAIRRVVAHKTISPDVLAGLARDKDVRVCQRVANNPHTPSKALAGLAGNEDWEVREAVARHSHTTPDILARLASDEIVDIRRAVADNPHTTPDTLAVLRNDKTWDVSNAALWSIKRIADLGLSGDVPMPSPTISQTNTMEIN